MDKAAYLAAKSHLLNLGDFSYPEMDYASSQRMRWRGLLRRNCPPPGRATAWAGLLSVAGVQEQRGPFAHV